MTRLSHVGNPSVYEAGDQRGPPTDIEQRHRGKRFLPSRRLLERPSDSGLANGETDIEEMKDTGHTSKKAAEHEHKTSQQRREFPHKREEEKETEMLKKDPTLPAQMHSNEPSRGAKIDKVLKNEDEAEIRQKDEAVAF
ncbi:hypothetical protein VE02_00736 [Pseudogymnoascus sp. 03VT05]|nr:hypothetical protein VE02_00736 [Pseudogymnoascus sp. 03VT05]